MVRDAPPETADSPVVQLPSGGCWRWCESFGVYFELVSHLLRAVVEGNSRSIPLVYFKRRAIHTGTCSSVSSKGCFQTGVQREGGVPLQF